MEQGLSYLRYPIQLNYFTECLVDVGCFSPILSLQIFHNFSIGLRSGQFPGHGRTSTFLFLRYDVTNLLCGKGRHRA